MAIGIGKNLGLKITKNFNYPYFATSISDFWRRWHISLTGWLTEYALSVDNIFVFIILLTHLKVQKERQQLVLLLGIMLTIAIRGLLIPFKRSLYRYNRKCFRAYGVAPTLLFT